MFDGNKEISSAQVIFPDRQTLDEVVAKLTNEITELKAKVDAQQTATTTE